MFVIFTFETATNLPELFAYILLFILGTTIGSFLNVVIHRVPARESLIFPSSACPKCGSAIRIFDNLPILSWLILGGKCRSCKNQISQRYPAVELLTALLFVLVFWQIGFNAFLPVVLTFVAAVISLVFIDAENMILPNVITYPLIFFAFLVRLIYPIFFNTAVFADVNKLLLDGLTGFPLWIVSGAGGILGAIAGGGSLWLVGEFWKRLRGVEAMGLGDVKMMLGVGALLGWRLALLSIFLGASVGAIAGIIVLARQKEKDFQTQMPFGVFLGIGSLIALLFGEQLIEWYFRVFF